MKINNNVHKTIEVGKVFNSYEDFSMLFKNFCAENYQPLIVTTNNARQVTIICRHGYNRPSKSTEFSIGGLCFKGQSSNSRENEENPNLRFNTFLHGEEDENELKVKYCILNLHLIFKENLAVNSFLHAFLHLNKETLHQDPQFTREAGAYYKELLNIALELNPIQLWTPQDFCNRMYEKEKNICTDVIARTGCEANDFGLKCVEHLYLTWKRKYEPYPNAVPGTECLYDEDLFNAIFKGSGNINDFSDQELLTNYYRTTRELCVDEEQQRDHLYEARSRAYGISNVSYADLCREYKRRQSLIKVYDDYYAMYLHNQIENHVSLAGSNFKNREQFCREYTSRQENDEEDEEQTEQQNYQQSDQQ